MKILEQIAGGVFYSILKWKDVYFPSYKIPTLYKLSHELLTVIMIQPIKSNIDYLSEPIMRVEFFADIP